MSTTDKTRQQLVDSMRKTKAGAAGKTAAGSKSPRPVKKTAGITKKPAATPAAKRSAKTEAGSRPVKKTAGTTKKPAATPAAKRSAKTEAGSRPEMRDPYRAGRRVWPD